MPTPGWGDAGTFLAGNTRTTSAIDVPANVAIGKFCGVGFYLESDTTPTPPAGNGTWATAATAETNATGQEHRIHLFWKAAIAADSSAGTWDFTHPSAWSAGFGFTLVDVNTTSPFSGTAQTGGHATPNFSEDSPTLGFTPPDSNVLLLHLAGSYADGAWTPPTAHGGFTERVDASLALELATLTWTSGAVSGVFSTQPTWAPAKTGILVAVKGLTDLVQGPTDNLGVTEELVIQSTAPVYGYEVRVG